MRAAQSPRRDHPQPGSQPRRRLRRDHRAEGCHDRLLTRAARTDTAIRQRFLHAAVFSGLIWLAVLLPMPRRSAPGRRTVHALGDTAIIGFFSSGERCSSRNRSGRSAPSSPPRCGSGSIWQPNYSVWLSISLFVAIVVSRSPTDSATSGAAGPRGPARNSADAAGRVHHVASVRLGQRLVSGSDHPACGDDCATTVLLGAVAEPGVYLVPTQGPLLLFGAAFDQMALTTWQLLYAVVYPVVWWSCCGGSARRCSAATWSNGRVCCDRDVPHRALAAFGRNDIRGTYRDPLLVMIVFAPVIWTTGVALLTPRSPRCWRSVTTSTSCRITRWC